MNAQRLRNFTTGILHTTMEDIDADLRWLLGRGNDDEIPPTSLVIIMNLVRPWLQEAVTDPRYWDGRYDTTHTGDYPLQPPTLAELHAAMDRAAVSPRSPREVPC